MAKITFQIKESWNNARYNHLYLDGKYLNSISSIEPESFNIEEGKHVLQVRFGLLKLFRSRKFIFSVSANDEKFFLAYTRKPRILLGAILGLIVGIIMFNEPFTTERGILAAVVFMVILIQYVLIFRRFSFKIEEVDPKVFS